jgi:hypothetical protein
MAGKNSDQNYFFLLKKNKKSEKNFSFFFEKNKKLIQKLSDNPPPGHVREKISASVDGGPSGGSRVRRPGSEDPHRR